MDAFGGEPSRSEAAHGTNPDDSLAVDVGHSVFNQPNLICPSSSDSSFSEAPSTPTFGDVIFAEDSLSRISETLHQVIPFAAQTLESSSYFPDTPAADMPSVDILTHQQLSNPNDDFEIISHLADGGSGQNTMFQFPVVSDPAWSSLLPASVGNALFCLSSTGSTPFTAIPDHVFEEEPPSLLDTPPTTPNENHVAGNRDLWAERQSLRQPRARLGGVSTPSLTIDDVDFDGDLNDLGVFDGLDFPDTWSSSLGMPVEDQHQRMLYDAAFSRSELEAAASGILIPPEEQIQHLADNSGLDVFSDLNLAEAGVMATSPVTRSQGEIVRENEIEGFFSCTERTTSTVIARSEPEAYEAGTAREGVEESQSAEPVLKKELRRKILKRRHDSGMGALDTALEPQPQCEHQMTEVDFARRDARRQQNRGAARRFREKMKQKDSDIIKKFEEAREKNRQLSSEMEALLDEIRRLLVETERHRHCGDPVLLQQAARSALHVLPDCRTAPHSEHMEDGADPRPR